MAHLWQRPRSGPWEATALSASPTLLSGSDPRGRSGADDETPARLVQHGDPSDDSDRWLLLARSGAAVRLNGRTVRGGLAALRDRDAIQLADRVVFFSTERLAVIEPLPALERPVHCPRDKTEIRTGTPAVRCPQCRTWHHQSSELPCWQYSQRCAICSKHTDLDAGYIWRPGETAR